ncbi:23S rRNA (guanine(745)-N(1))-methyltransferase [Alteromonas facilis]|uniref:23S rRNA (guanine(745)-N(1))-methyltransferase n=1 Tax=Alteromonas facilis TaxID=2048004 RepID=UPI000C290CFD|nr:23S rRNA (guanine(745)-N(1))-methyltransferase [Alteromonas facilis]
MKDSQFNLWQCPLCQSTLLHESSRWVCANHHSFDIAKEGYVNLLPAQHKKSKDPGDSKAMVMARQHFLNAQHYQPLATRIAEHIQTYHSDGMSTLFDIGCGEGYYLRHITQQLSDANIENQGWGIDISKPAIQKAAKQSPHLHFAVASTFHVPIASHSISAAFQVFAPSSAKEVHRILVNEGIWITVEPNQKHLFELKALIYDTPELHTVKVEEHSGFQLETNEQLSFKIHLTTPEIREQLLMMTPFYWTISPEKLAKVKQSLTHVTADFVVKTYRKLANCYVL